MKFVEDRIVKDGEIGDFDVLRVDSFLNHQMDIGFLRQVGQAFYDLYKDAEINKILTIEASGIGIACVVAEYFNVPVVFAKKAKTSNIGNDVYTAAAHSYTHGNDVTIMVSKKYLHEEDNILIIDDFLARGSALASLIQIAKDAKAKVAGAGIVIEKAYQGGGDEIRAMGVRVESLARIASMSAGHIEFCK